MKAALFNPIRYAGLSPGGWPVAPSACDPEIGQRSMLGALENLRLADELGFDWVTMAEHHYGGFSLTPNPMVLAGALTQVVKRARIALLGPIVPVLNPVRVAEEFAMLDNLTSGRIVAGLLRGTPNEYVTYNINPAESRVRFEEALALIRRAWTEPEPFGWQGRFYQYRSIAVWPRIVQAPHPPLYMSGSSPESGTVAARNRLGLGLAFTTVPLASRAARFYREEADRLDWQPDRDQVVYRMGFHVAETDEQAMADMVESGGDKPHVGLTMANKAVLAGAMASGYFGRAAEEQKDRVAPRDAAERVKQGQILLGSPETVWRQICRVRDEVGAGVLDLFPTVPIADRTTRSIELFGTKVLPRLHEN
jgi:alkanesulfonate monooxygenase SsuD/methylene tetrahydromethanopterin reductase-like flavin-dependent oxidoreductase (luciferase family)